MAERTIEEMQARLDELKKLLPSSEKKAKKVAVATIEELKDIHLLDLVDHLVENKKLVSWKAAHSVAYRAYPEDYEAEFKYTKDVKKLKALFKVLTEGGDALLVDVKGKYSSNAPVEKHQAWLAEKGYENTQVSVKVQKVAAVG